jgi:transcription elongation factor Elf1
MHTINGCRIIRRNLRMNIKVVCSSCNKEFDCGVEQKLTKVKQRKIKHCKTQKELVVTYFHCPYCSHEHIVQLDDNNTMELFKEVISQMRNKVILSRQGKNVSKKDSIKFKKNRNLLTTYRTELMREFDGDLFTEESGIEFELKCTMGFMDEGDKNE